MKYPKLLLAGFDLVLLGFVCMHVCPDPEWEELYIDSPHTQGRARKTI